MTTPKDFTIKKTALFGMLSALTVLMLNVPIVIENTYAYGIEDNSELSDEKYLVKNHFITGSPVHPNLIIDDDLNRSGALEERSNTRNHFSYGQTEPSDVSLVDNIHEKRRD